MKLRNAWYWLSGRIRKPIWHPKAEMPTEVLFTEPCGIRNFRYVDLDHTNALRLMKLDAVKEELDQRVTRELLTAHVELTDKLLNGGRLADAALLNKQLGDRLNNIMPDQLLILKYAAIASFDETENPADVDMVYVEAKIKRWHKQGVTAFFLSRSLGMFAAASETSEQDFQTYSKAATLLSLVTLESLISGPYKEFLTEPTLASLRSQAEQLKAILQPAN